MFSVGQTVMFLSAGVCTVREIAAMDTGAGVREYYVLAPVYDARSTVYVPADNAEMLSQMRPVITAGEIDELIAEVSAQKCEWIADDAARKEFCDEILRSGDRKGLMCLIEMLYLRREELRANKKRFQIADDNNLKKAEKMLHDEFSYALGIDREAVPGYIMEKAGRVV